MTFLEYLTNEYGYNEPILLSEISFGNYSKPWIQRELRLLCDANKLVRYEKGVYYIPTQTVLGLSKLDARKVIKKKYLDNDRDIIGYYSGITLLNALGLSTQMPNLLEIYTNNEQSRAREVIIGNQKVLIRKCRAEINAANVAAMMLLELMNFTDARFYDYEKRAIVNEFIRNKRITRNDITQNGAFFPDKAFRTLVESGVIFDVTL